MASVTVPGVAGTVITYNNVFTNPQNTALAQQIANALAAASVAGSLTVNADNGTSGPPPSSSGTNELAVSTSGAVITVPTGYQFTVDSTGGGSGTILGVQNFIGGSGNLNVTNTAGSGTDTIAVGNGSDVLWLVQGSTYDVAAGNGADTFTAVGTGTITGGTGSNTFFIGGPTSAFGSASNTVFLNGTDTANAGYGSATITASGTDLINNGPGADTDFLAGTATVNSFANTSSTIIGGPSANPELVFGNTGASQFISAGGTNLTFVAGSSDSATVLGGTNAATLWGGSGSSISFTGSAAGALFIAGAGNETLNAASSASPVTLFGGSGGDSLVGGSGGDVLFAGSGSDTMTGGAGNNFFEFYKGVGGNHTITDFSSNDLVALFGGYGSAAGANALAAATVSGGSTKIALSDNTTITFTNITNPNSIKIYSA